MKILITGACGHIGSHFVENLYKIKKVKKAILVDNLKSNRFNSLFNINHKNKVEFFLKDLNDPKSLNQFKNINIVFHLVGLIGWLIVSLMWNDRALIIINAVGIAIMANGLLGYFMGE